MAEKKSKSKQTEAVNNPQPSSKNLNTEKSAKIPETVVKYESVESKVYANLKKYFKYDSFKSETQKTAVLEIVKRKNDVYGRR